LLLVQAVQDSIGLDTVLETLIQPHQVVTATSLIQQLVLVMVALVVLLQEEVLEEAT
jgi:hypothetical protein